MAQSLLSAGKIVSAPSATGTVGAAKPAPAPDLDRIRRNVEKMVGSGAPKEHIDTYLSGEGYTADTFRAAMIEPPRATNRPSPLGSIADYFHGITDAAQQGMTLGFADEVGAAGSATGGAIRQLLEGRPVTWGSNYEDALGRQRGSEAEFAENNPIASTTAMITGGLASLPMLRGAPGAAVPVASMAARSPVGTVARLAGTGAGVGAAAGFGAAEGGVGNRLQGMGQGAALGGVLGTVLPGLAVVGGKGVQFVKNMAGLQNPKKKALDYALKKMAQDEVTPASALRALSTTKPVVIADLGENLQRAGVAVPATD